MTELSPQLERLKNIKKEIETDPDMDYYKRLHLGTIIAEQKKSEYLRLLEP